LFSCGQKNSRCGQKKEKGASAGRGGSLSHLGRIKKEGGSAPAEKKAFPAGCEKKKGGPFPRSPEEKVLPSGKEIGAHHFTESEKREREGHPGLVKGIK